MIEVKTPKNILVYKTKILGPLNIRQTICFTIVGILDFFVYQMFIKGAQLPPEVIFYIFVFLDVPILLFGYYEPMGMPLEKYIKYYMQSMFVSPKYRKNKHIIYKRNEEIGKKTKKSKTLKAYR